MQHPFQAFDFFAQLPLEAFDFAGLDAHGQFGGFTAGQESELRHV